MQGNPLTMGALAERSATQKSCRGSGSAAWTALREAAAQMATMSMVSQVALADVFAIAAAAAPSAC